jgi:hypothetical protein
MNDHFSNLSWLATNHGSGGFICLKVFNSSTSTHYKRASHFWYLKVYSSDESRILVRGKNRGLEDWIPAGSTAAALEQELGVKASENGSLQHSPQKLKDNWYRKAIEQVNCDWNFDKSRRIILRKIHCIISSRTVESHLDDPKLWKQKVEDLTELCKKSL